MRHRADGSSTLLKVSPSLVVSLSLVKIDGSCIFIHLVEPKLVLVTLVPQYIWWPSKKNERERKKMPNFFLNTRHHFNVYKEEAPYVPNRMQPGSLREFSAFVLIMDMKSSIRSGLISASTMTENGFDMSLVVE